MYGLFHRLALYADTGSFLLIIRLDNQIDR